MGTCVSYTSASRIEIYYHVHRCMNHARAQLDSKVLRRVYSPKATSDQGSLVRKMDSVIHRIVISQQP